MTIESFNQVLASMAKEEGYVKQFDEACDCSLYKFYVSSQLPGMVTNPVHLALDMELQMFYDYTFFFVYRGYIQQEIIRNFQQRRQ